MRSFLAALILSSAALARTAGAEEAKSNAPPVAPATPGELPPIVFDAPVKLKLDLHGALWLWYYQPLSKLEDPHPDAPPQGPGDPSLEVWVASFTARVTFDKFGLYVNPRFRDTRSRAFFTSNVWLQQGYVSYDAPHALIKAGKIENVFSSQNDDSFALNLLYFDGIKYESDYGVSVEGSHTWDSGLGLAYAAQYFISDAHTNGSLRDRETSWVDGAKRQHIGVLRAEPSYRFGTESSLRAGAAFEAFHIDLDNGTSGTVVRLDGDVSFNYGPARVFGEVLAQFGKSVTSYPIVATPTLAGQASGHNYYAIAGAGFRIWRFYPRYVFDYVRYADTRVSEMVHMPGVTFTAHDNISLLLEYGYWLRRDPGRTYLLDNSLNFLVNGRF